MNDDGYDDDGYNRQHDQIMLWSTLLSVERLFCNDFDKLCEKFNVLTSLNVQDFITETKELLNYMQFFRCLHMSGFLTDGFGINQNFNQKFLFLIDRSVNAVYDLLDRLKEQRGLSAKDNWSFYMHCIEYCNGLNQTMFHTFFDHPHLKHFLSQPENQIVLKVLKNIPAYRFFITNHGDCSTLSQDFLESWDNFRYYDDFSDYMDFSDFSQNFVMHGETSIPPLNKWRNLYYDLEESGSIIDILDSITGLLENFPKICERSSKMLKHFSSPSHNMYSFSNISSKELARINSPISVEEICSHFCSESSPNLCPENCKSVNGTIFNTLSDKSMHTPIETLSSSTQNDIKAVLNLNNPNISKDKIQILPILENKARFCVKLSLELSKHLEFVSESLSSLENNIQDFEAETNRKSEYLSLLVNKERDFFRNSNTGAFRHYYEIAILPIYLYGTYPNVTVVSRRLLSKMPLVGLVFECFDYILLHITYLSWLLKNETAILFLLFVQNSLKLATVLLKFFTECGFCLLIISKNNVRCQSLISRFSQCSIEYIINSE